MKKVIATIATIVSTPVSFSNSSAFFKKLAFAKSLTKKFAVNETEILALADGIENSNDLDLVTFSEKLIIATSAFVTEKMLTKMKESETKKAEKAAQKAAEITATTEPLTAEVLETV